MLKHAKGLYFSIPIPVSTEHKNIYFGVNVLNENPHPKVRAVLYSGGPNILVEGCSENPIPTLNYEQGLLQFVPRHATYCPD